MYYTCLFILKYPLQMALEINAWKENLKDGERQRERERKGDD